MPSAQLRLEPPRKFSGPEEGVQNRLPPVLRTPSGTIMMDIQGVINLGESPLITGELDVGVDKSSKEHKGPVRIGQFDYPDDAKDGSQVSLMIGNNQKLWGTLQKLKVPLAVLDMTRRPEGDDAEIPVVDIIKYKALFNKRPEPVLNQD